MVFHLGASMHFMDVWLRRKVDMAHAVESEEV